MMSDTTIDSVFLATAIVVIVGLVMLIGLQNQNGEPNGAFITEIETVELDAAYYRKMYQDIIDEQQITITGWAEMSKILRAELETAYEERDNDY